MGVLAIVALVLLAGRGMQPPESIRFATGIEGGGYWRVGMMYRAALARDGIDVELVETSGTLENLDLLYAGDVDVALVQGGIEIDPEEGLQSLGAMFVEPIVVFRRADRPLPSNIAEWDGVRLAAGPEGSGTRAAARSLMAIGGLTDGSIAFSPLAGFEATEALQAGEVDLVLFVSPIVAPYLTAAFKDPSLEFMPMSYVGALTARLPGAREVIAPAGGATLEPPRPAQDTPLLALQGSMIAAGHLHPAVIDRLVQAARRLHSDSTVLHKAGEFPNTQSPPVPLNGSAWELIETGPNALHGVLPFWMAAQFGRLLVLILPLLFLLPMLGAIPSGYGWFQRRRVLRHYKRIGALELQLSEASTTEELQAVAAEIERLDARLANLKLPLAFRQSAFDARLHVDLVRKETARRME